MVSLKGRLERLEAAAEEARLGRMAQVIAADTGLPVGEALAILHRELAAAKAYHARHCRGWGGPAADEPCVRWAAAELGIQPEEIMREAERMMAGPEAAR